MVESNGVVTRYDVASGAIMARATLAGAADEEFAFAALDHGMAPRVTDPIVAGSVVTAGSGRGVVRGR